MKQVFNFSAGPAMLPPPVMQQAQAEFLNWRDSGCSVMEVSHRGADFIEIAAQAEQDLRDLLGISDDYHVIFSQGGGRGQFAAVPLNISQPTDTSLHLVTGSWSKGAVDEAKKYNKPVVIGSSVVEEGIIHVPKPAAEAVDQSAAYLHFCPNETVDGIAFDWLPDAGNVPLVADLSSTILSRPIDVSKYGIIYAGAQKNIGPSGLAIVIVRKDLAGKAQIGTPSIFDYAVMAEKDSMYNTPPTFSWYLAGLVFKWLKSIGGLPAIEKLNQQKAALLYDAIDGSAFYRNNIATENRSLMNVPFQLVNEELNAQFLSESKQAGLMALKGHRSVGGMRASIYNAMPLAGVQALVDFMHDFAQKNG